MFAVPLPISPVCLLGGPWGSARQDILSKGPVCIRIGAVGREGPSGQARVPIWSGLGCKHILSPGYRSSQVREGIELRNKESQM